MMFLPPYCSLTDLVVIHNFDLFQLLVTGSVAAQNYGVSRREALKVPVCILLRTLSQVRVHCTQDTCTMNGDEFTKTAEITVETAYFTSDATTLPCGDILRRLTRIWRHRRGGGPSVRMRARPLRTFSHIYTRCCLCIQSR